MENRTYYYARVSNTDQNLDRQMKAFKGMGADDRNIITDKASGKDFERSGYQALKTTRLLLNPLTGFQGTKLTLSLSLSISKSTA